MRQLMKRRVKKLFYAVRAGAVKMEPKDYNFIRSMFYRSNPKELSDKQEKWINDIWTRHGNDATRHAMEEADRQRQRAVF
jgi:hypothetical protein